MARSEIKPTPSPAPPVLSNCPQCRARLAILRVVARKAGAEYWTMRCTRCGGIHLDVVKRSAPAGLSRSAALGEPVALGPNSFWLNGSEEISGRIIRFIQFKVAA
jgi:hypothetical protein